MVRALQRGVSTKCWAKSCGQKDGDCGSTPLVASFFSSAVNTSTEIGSTQEVKWGPWLVSII